MEELFLKENRLIATTLQSQQNYRQVNANLNRRYVQFILIILVYVFVQPDSRRKPVRPNRPEQVQMNARYVFYANAEER
jgi:hypothetical protein